MPKIPITTPYHEDELLYSWVSRLSKLNGFDNLKDFVAIFIQNKPFKSSSTLLYDLQNLTGLTDTFSIAEVVKIFQETTLYPFFFIFMSEEYQSYYMNSIFRIQSSTSDIRYASHRVFNDLYYCPLCRKEEIDRYGEFYYHRTHQLPNVRCCTKHACLLHKYKGKPSHEFETENINEQIEYIDKNSIEYRFALFSEMILNGNFDLNVNDVKQMIKDKLSDEHLPNNLSGNQTYINRLKEKNIFRLVPEDELKYFLTRKINDKSSPMKLFFIYLLFDLFGHANKIINNKKSPDSLFHSFLKEHNYELISGYRGYLISIRHNSCGYTFITTPYALLHGWECPKCDLTKNDQEIIEHQISKINDNSYELVDEFKSWHKQLSIRHKTCEKISKYYPRDFLINSTRCSCTHHVTYKQVKSLIEKTGEFELVSFTSTNEPMTIKHNFCGSTFETFYYDFYKHPYCKKCKVIYATTPKTVEEFNAEMKKITTERYQVMGDYTHRGQILLVHENCGTPFYTSAYRFLTGKRCPRCYKNIKSNKLKTFISETSKGRYEAIGKQFGKEIISIKDTETEKVLELPKKLVIQELTRPTPSSILPGYNNLQTKPMFYDYEELYDDIFNYLNLYKIIFSNDIKNTFSHNCITLLMKKRKLKKICTGAYCLPDCEYTPDDVIYAKFIKRDTRYLGYYYSDSFDYSIGLLTNKPATVRIASTKCRNYQTQERNILGQKFIIKQAKCKNLNSRNVTFLPILEKLNFRRKLTQKEIKFYKTYLKTNDIKKQELLDYVIYYPNLDIRKIDKLYESGES